jgi:uncharacterized protein YvpB
MIMQLSVPYYSQFIDIQDPFWMLRACGAASFKMVAEYHGKSVPGLLDLCKEAQERGGYNMNNGWVHDYLVMKMRESGLVSERKEGVTDIGAIITSLDKGNPVIASVEKRILEQTRFHMIVIVGYDDKDIIYHEPESTDRERGQYRRCSRETFIEYWRGKVIFSSL